MSRRRSNPAQGIILGAALSLILWAGIIIAVLHWWRG